MSSVDGNEMLPGRSGWSEGIEIAGEACKGVDEEDDGCDDEEC